MTFSTQDFDRLKREVNLTALAASDQGYAIDRRASSRNSIVMRRADGDKIIVARGRNGTWIYFNVHDPSDSGTALDFIRRRRGGSLGDAGRYLEAWQGRPPPPLSEYVATLEPLPRDVVAVRAACEASRPLRYGEHDYLNRKRRLSPLLLAFADYVGRIRTDARGNAVFPHRDADGVCGFEIKNDRFTGFSPGGSKGLWQTQSLSEYWGLVVSEGAIDALSYAALHGPRGLRLVSVAGAMSPGQRLLLTQAIANFDGERVVVATDNDKAGDKLTATVGACFASAGRDDLQLVVDRPPVRGQDWNDVLRNSPRPLPPGLAP
jgi:hypothetical protein